MATFPFLQILHTQVPASSEQTVSFSVPDGETVEIHDIRIISDGTFNVIGMRSSKSRAYSNASSGSPIPGEYFADPANQFNGFSAFPIPIRLEGNIDFYIDLVDTSAAANDVYITLALTKEVPGNG